MIYHDKDQVLEFTLKSILWDILARHYLFGILPANVVESLSGQFSTRVFKTGQYVFHQDDLADRFYVIVEGEISIETINMDGRITKIAHLGSGDIFGEFALIDEGGRSASAKVEHDAQLASLSSAQFHRLMEEHPVFTRKLMSVLVERLRGSNHQIESLVTLNLSQRTARLLLTLSKSHGPVITITQKQLGERLFASREKVNGHLKDMEKSGAIQVRRGRIDVINPVVLNQKLDEN